MPSRQAVTSSGGNCGEAASRDVPMLFGPSQEELFPMIRNHKSDGGASVFASAKIARRSFLGLSGAVGAAGALAASVPAAPAKAREWKRRPTLVLIHGSWHGAWCFQLTASLLINEGFRVVALDRPGSGLNAQFPSSLPGGEPEPK
jgi:pimeloyl-ACP methyl ester carboxylesterase